MAKTPFNFIALFKAAPGREKDLERILTDMVVPTRAEGGNVNYDLHVYQDDPTRMALYEGWTGKDALDSHMKSPHFQKMLKELDGAVAERDEKGQPFHSIPLKMASERAW